MSLSSSTNGSNKGKLDVYGMIAAKQLGKLALEVSRLVPLKSE